jgi:8-oxo-dGTP diphosphatase
MARKCMTSCGVILHRGKILMFKHKKLRKWLFPGGHVEANEDPLEAVIRETKEETGLDIKVIDAGKGTRLKYKEVIEPQRPLSILIENVHYGKKLHVHFDFVYLAKLGDAREIITQEEELGEFRWFGRKDVDLADTSEDVKDMMRLAFKHAKEI